MEKLPSHFSLNPPFKTLKTYHSKRLYIRRVIIFINSITANQCIAIRQTFHTYPSAGCGKCGNYTTKQNPKNYQVILFCFVRSRGPQQQQREPKRSSIVGIVAFRGFSCFDFFFLFLIFVFLLL
jgi:hypothetical protein